MSTLYIPSLCNDSPALDRPLTIAYNHYFRNTVAQSDVVDRWRPLWLLGRGDQVWRDREPDGVQGTVASRPREEVPVPSCQHESYDPRVKGDQDHAELWVNLPIYFAIKNV